MAIGMLKSSIYRAAYALWRRKGRLGLAVVALCSLVSFTAASAIAFSDPIGAAALIGVSVSLALLAFIAWSVRRRLAAFDRRLAALGVEQSVRLSDLEAAQKMAVARMGRDIEYLQGELEAGLKGARRRLDVGLSDEAAERDRLRQKFTEAHQRLSDDVRRADEAVSRVQTELLSEIDRTIKLMSNLIGESEDRVNEESERRIACLETRTIRLGQELHEDSAAVRRHVDASSKVLIAEFGNGVESAFERWVQAADRREKRLSMRIDEEMAGITAELERRASEWGTRSANEAGLLSHLEDRIAELSAKIGRLENQGPN